jgi:hypothetical protein
VVTWCRHHRYIRDYDNVLFFDGSVQYLPKDQDNINPNSADCAVDAVKPILTGAERKPRRDDCT